MKIKRDGVEQKVEKPSLLIFEIYYNIFCSIKEKVAPNTTYKLLQHFLSARGQKVLWRSLTQLRL